MLCEICKQAEATTEAWLRSGKRPPDLPTSELYFEDALIMFNVCDSCLAIALPDGTRSQHTPLVVDTYDTSTAVFPIDDKFPFD